MTNLATHPKAVLHVGMMTTRGVICLVLTYQDSSLVEVRVDRGEIDEWLRADQVELDIEHPATKGWLLAMLREATGDAALQPESRMTIFGDFVWRCRYAVRCWVDGYPTEGAALESALLAALGEVTP